jgi:hypothetical protein
MEHGDFDIHGYWDDLIRKLSKQGTETKQKRLPTSGPFWTNHQVSLVQER